MVTHGSVAVLVRWLNERGLQAEGFKTEYGDEDVADRAAPEPLSDAAVSADGETGAA
jgi:putative mRNA 3-end processing factor